MLRTTDADLSCHLEGFRPERIVGQPEVKPTRVVDDIRALRTSFRKVSSRGGVLHKAHILGGTS
jgi:hypothetical protein